MRRAGLIAALLVASPAAAEDTPLAPPNPELLVFLGEIAGDTPQQRERLRKGWERFRELSPEQQDTLR